MLENRPLGTKAGVRDEEMSRMAVSCVDHGRFPGAGPSYLGPSTGLMVRGHGLNSRFRMSWGSAD